MRGLDARTNIGYAWSRPGAARDSEPDVHEDYVSAYDLGPSRVTRSGGTTNEQNPVLRDLLPTITTPAQILAGRDDPRALVEQQNTLHDLLPHSGIHPLDAGHFAWEEAAEEYGGLVADWASGGYRRVGRASARARRSATTRPGGRASEYRSRRRRRRTWCYSPR